MMTYGISRLRKIRVDVVLLESIRIAHHQTRTKAKYLIVVEQTEKTTAM